MALGFGLSRQVRSKSENPSKTYQPVARVNKRSLSIKFRAELWPKNCLGAFVFSGTLYPTN